MSILGLGKIDLPRERLARYGSSKLSDDELLAVLLGSGIKGQNVLLLSKKVLRLIRESGAEKLTVKHIQKIRGLGEAKASQIIACIELGRRLAKSARPEVLSAMDIWKLCSDFRNSKREHFAAFYLDTHNCLLERQVISIGTLSESLVHPREVFEPALTLRAASIIVVHNHPSGVLTVSEEDRRVTQRLKEAGSILGIELLDHIIITADTHESLENLHLL